MNFVSLLIHGLSALFANQEVVGTRLLVIVLLMTASLFLGISVVVGTRLLTHLTIPDWAATSMGLVLILVSQLLIGAFMLVFSMMMERSHLGFLPIRDYIYFVRGESKLYSR
jgi:hypothetical protein